MDRHSFATKEEIWRLQESLTDLSASQLQQADRIMRLEKKHDDTSRNKSVWGPSSPFPSVLGSTQHEPSLNPAAEAFRNFDGDGGTTMMSSLTLDNADDSRRAAASRANSVRFDESANNHYGSSRQSMELPARTGSGLGAHPLSERSLSHRSDGRGSAAGFGRTNSFGLEQSRLLASIHNSPRVSGNPPLGFFVLGPCPCIIRCWLTEVFTNDSLLYAAVCTGSAFSTIGLSLVQKLGLDDSIIEEGGIRKIRLPVYLTEARIQFPSSRPVSPAPQVPTVIAKFVINEQPGVDKSIQIVLGSDVLRTHMADILFSQDKMTIYDEDRNQLWVPFARPEDEASYKSLGTFSVARINSFDPAAENSNVSSASQPTPGIIGRPGRVDFRQPPHSPTVRSPSLGASTVASASGDIRKVDTPSEPLSRTSLEISVAKNGDESTTESEKSSTTPVTKTNSGVWGSSWRSASGAGRGDPSKTASSYARPPVSREMNVLRPSKATGAVMRTTSTSSQFLNGTDGQTTKPDENAEATVRPSAPRETKSSTTTPSKSNPVGSGSAFGWLTSSQPRN